MSSVYSITYLMTILHWRSLPLPLPNLNCNSKDCFSNWCLWALWWSLTLLAPARCTHIADRFPRRAQSHPLSCILQPRTLEPPYCCIPQPRKHKKKKNQSPAILGDTFYNVYLWDINSSYGNRHSSVNIVTRLRVGWAGFRFRADETNSSPLRNVLTSSVAHPFFHSTGVKTARAWTTHPHLVPRLWMSGVLPLLPLYTFIA